MQRGIVRAVIGGSLGGILVVGLMSPALADISKSGSLGCGQDYGADVHSYSSARTRVTINGIQTVYHLGSVMTHKQTWATHSGPATWKVSTNGTLSDPGTYGQCELTGVY